MLVNLKKLRKSRNKNRIGKGIYLTKGFNQFNFDSFLRRYGVDFFRKFTDIVDEGERHISSFGVCDNPQQILEYIPELETSTEKFVIGLTKVRRLERPNWRWKKWGKYIGTQKTTQEYLGDEKDIDEVYFYEIYKIK